MVTYRCLSPILIICESVIKQAGRENEIWLLESLLWCNRGKKIAVRFSNTKCLEWNWTYCMVNKYCCITNILLQNLFLSLCAERMSKRSAACSRQHKCSQFVCYWVHDNWPQQTDRKQTDREQRRLAEKSDPKYIFTIPRAILPKPSLCDEITATKWVTKSL